MNRKLVDILACPMDKHHPLELYVCKMAGEAISEGALYCTKCSRFYPIMGKIPVMMPDDLRDKDSEMDFLRTNMEDLPDKIIRQAHPWHL